jgi:hypothetical protein
MKIVCFGFAILLALLNVGCKPTIETALQDEEIAAPSFSEKSGLFLPEATKQSLDLKLAEVTEQTVATSLPLTLRVYQTDEKAILATGVLTPEQSSQLKPGQAIKAKLTDGTTLTGTVRAIRTEMRHATGSDELLAEFSGTTTNLTIGDFFPVTARTGSNAKVVAIPRQALLQNSEGQFAYTVSGEHFVRTAIKTGASNDEFIEVTDGLYAGDQVVLQPVMSLWLTELSVVKGGQACCVEPPKGK